MSSGYVSGSGACEWIICCGCCFVVSRVCILVAPSVYVSEDDWRGRGGALFLVGVAVVASFPRGVWFWLPVSAGAGWVEELFVFVPSDVS